jgi:hypothetical protein
MGNMSRDFIKLGQKYVVDEEQLLIANLPRFLLKQQKKT